MGAESQCEPVSDPSFSWLQVLHEYWMTLRDHVSAIDELGMATERLRVRLPDEPKQKVLHIIEPQEVKEYHKPLDDSRDFCVSRALLLLD